MENEPDINQIIAIMLDSKFYIDKDDYTFYEFKFVDKIDENHIKFMNTDYIYITKSNLIKDIYI